MYTKFRLEKLPPVGVAVPVLAPEPGLAAVGAQLHGESHYC
jgi:hypothetical protein